MLRIAICDDNREFLDRAETTLSLWPNKPNDLKYECFTESVSLLDRHKEAPFDIILLDVVMPFVNGLEAARELRQKDKLVKIVFLTSSPEYAVDSYTVKASNYLIKPVNKEAFYSCLDELYAELRQSVRSITVRSASTVHRVELGSIEFVEAQNKNTLFTLTDGTVIKSTEPLYSFEDKLLFSDGFYKCHRSYIVNLHQIYTYTIKEIKMRSGCSIPISRTYHSDFKKAYFSALFDKAGDME